MSRSYDPYASPNPKRFYRSRNDKVISGVTTGSPEAVWRPLLSLLRRLSSATWFVLTLG